MGRRLTSATGLLLFGGILVVLNLLASLLPLRLDLSRGGIYSLSKASKRLVASLEDPVLVRAYFSDTLPPQYAASRRYLESFLKEYTLASKGKFRFEFVRVEGEGAEENRREAMSEGISPIRFNIYSRERLEVREGLMGLTLRHLDKRDTIPFLQDISGLEYDLTSRIRRMAQKAKPEVAFVSGFGSAGPGDLSERTRAGLEANYEVRTLDLAGSTQPIQAGLKGVLLLGPSQALGPKARYALDQHLMGGGVLLVAADTRRVDLRSFFSNVQQTDLPAWLERYGAGVETDMVLDTQNQKVSVTTQQGWFQMTNIVDFPPMVLATDLDRTHPSTRELEGLVLPFSSPLRLSTAAASGAIHATVLARSSRASWIRKAWGQGFASFNPFQGVVPEPEDARGPFVLAAALEGSFSSAFESPPEGAPGAPFLAKAAPGARLAVIGTSRFIRAETPMPPVNEAFFLNLVDWMAQDPDLIAIRSKGIAFKPLKALGEGRKAAIRYANIFGPALAVLAFGGWRWDRRRRWKASRARHYGLADV